MADERRDRRPLLGALASGLVVLFFFGWFVTFGPGHSTEREPSAIEAMATQGSPRPSVSPATVASVVPQVNSAPASVSSGVVSDMSDAEALTSLAEKARADAGTIDFHGQWVAQLASKYPGIVDPQQLTASGSHTFGAHDILAEHQTLDDTIRGATVLLLDSRTFGNARTNAGQPYWVTVALDPEFTSADKILGWCAEQFPDLSGTELNNHCLPTQLTPPTS